MTGRRQRWTPLQLLLISSLLILTNQIEVRGGVEERLSRDIAAGRLLQGTSEARLQELLKNSEIRLIPDQLLLHNEKDLGGFLVRWDRWTTEDWLQSVSEMSPSFRRELLVLTSSTNSSHGKTRQESSFDPQQGVPVPIRSCRSESDQQTGSGFPASSQSPDGPMVQSDHQLILMLEDDEVVKTAAASLYFKHPTLSSLHAVDPQQRVRQVKGQAGVVSEHSSLVLVGHGARDHSGEMRVSGYSSTDVARIIQSSSRISQKIHTTTVVACDVGSDRRFGEALLKTLHEAGIQTELHLWNTVVQVAETGEVLSQDGAQWRSGDDTKKVVLTVGRKGAVLRRSGRGQSRGSIVHTQRADILPGGKRNKGTTVKVPNNPTQPFFSQNWPTEPRTFIDPTAYSKLTTKSSDQNQVERTFRILEGMTWGLFHPDPDPRPQPINEQERLPENYLIGRRDGETFNWIHDNNQKDRVLQRCYVIKTGSDIRNIIRHYAKDGEKEDSYLLINDWMFLVEPDGLYVYPIGKRLKDGEHREGENLQGAIMELIKEQNRKGNERYDNIRGNVQESEKGAFVGNVRNIFQGQPVDCSAFRQELFVIWYFTASVIAESARNFRTFPLTLMALSMEDNRFWFDQNYITMADGGTWLEPNLRGFTGAASGYPEKLVSLLAREYKVMSTWQQVVVKEQKGADEFTVMAATAQELNILQQNEKDPFIAACTTFFNGAGPYQAIQQTSGSLQQEDKRGGPAGSIIRTSRPGGSKVGPRLAVQAV